MASVDSYNLSIPFRGGKAKRIKFTPNVFAICEESLGLENIVVHVQQTFKAKGMPGFRVLRMMVHQGNLAAGGTMTLLEVGEDMDCTQLIKIWETIMKAINLCCVGRLTPVVDKEEDADPTVVVEAITPAA